MTLYAVHVQGPDEIIAAPSKLEAEVLADKLNAYFVEMWQKRGPAAPLIEAVVIKYPFSADSHAKQLADDWEGHAKFIGPIDREPERDTQTIDMFKEQR